MLWSHGQCRNLCRRQVWPALAHPPKGSVAVERSGCRRRRRGSPGIAGGEKIPRKGGPGITRSDLLIINKTDLAPHVGADLAVMARHAKMQRGERPFIFTNLRSGAGVAEVIRFIRTQGLLDEARAARH